MSMFMVFLRGGEAGWAKFTPEEVQRTVQMYTDWVIGMSSQPWFRGTEHLEDGGWAVKAGDGGITTSPYAETQNSTVAYVLVEAADHEAAATMTQQCPILTYGGYLHVREITPRAQM